MMTNRYPSRFTQTPGDINQLIGNQYLGSYLGYVLDNAALNNDEELVDLYSRLLPPDTNRLDLTGAAIGAIRSNRLDWLTRFAPYIEDYHRTVLETIDNNNLEALKILIPFLLKRYRSGSRWYSEWNRYELPNPFSILIKEEKWPFLYILTPLVDSSVDPMIRSNECSEIVRLVMEVNRPWTDDDRGILQYCLTRIADVERVIGLLDYLKLFQTESHGMNRKQRYEWFMNEFESVRWPFLIKIIEDWAILWPPQTKALFIRRLQHLDYLGSYKEELINKLSRD